MSDKEKKVENKYKKIEWDGKKDPIVQERTKCLAKTRNDNREVERNLLASLLKEKTEWEKLEDYERVVGDMNRRLY